MKKQLQVYGRMSQNIHFINHFLVCLRLVGLGLLALTGHACLLCGEATL